MSSNLNYISLFSSAGVGCYGFLLEGFDCIATAELIERRLQIQKYNNVCKNEDGYISGDLRKDEVKNSIFARISQDEVQKDIDVLIATPPCQGISVANLKKKNELSRNSLVVESIILTKKILPKVFIYENVRGFLKAICTDIDGSNKSIKEAIEINLSKKYNIEYKIVNFKDYGVPSSRTRTLVIGVRKDLNFQDVKSLFPKEKPVVTFRNATNGLESLTEMGEISPNDIYHAFRSYPDYMRIWISDLKEGQGAFQNTHPDRIPYKIVNGERVQNKNKSGDKYKRWYWDDAGPCIHTRNDQLASQNTIHPSDDRVFSIRELMRMMSIPDSFRWSEQSLQELNMLPSEEKRKHLKKNEMNIRQCIGEAVPTLVFKEIAYNLKKNLL